MSNSPATIALARLRAGRERWVDLDDNDGGRKVKYLRPPRGELDQFIDAFGNFAVGLKHVQTLMVDWKGFSEATLFGASVGSSDQLPFDPALWAEVVADDVDMMVKVRNHLRDCVLDDMRERGLIEKNSEPGLTPAIETPAGTSETMTTENPA